MVVQKSEHIFSLNHFYSVPRNLLFYRSIILPTVIVVVLQNWIVHVCIFFDKINLCNQSLIHSVFIDGLILVRHCMKDCFNLSPRSGEESQPVTGKSPCPSFTVSDLSPLTSHIASPSSALCSQLSWTAVSLRRMQWKVSGITDLNQFHEDLIFSPLLLLCATA